MNNRSQMPVVLSIAGSDNTAGAGIQADLKTCNSLGVYCTTVITALTAQDRSGLHQCNYVGDRMLQAQLEASLYHFKSFDAIKIGMIPNQQSAQLISDFFIKNNIKESIIIDPVMSASSGGYFTNDLHEYKAIASCLFKHCFMLTPNVNELIKLAEFNDIDVAHTSEAEMVNTIFNEYACENILVKGGHREGNCIDILYSKKDGRIGDFSSDRIVSSNTHGTGCTLSSAIASHIALGYNLHQSIKLSKEYITKAIINGALGSVNQFFK